MTTEFLEKVKHSGEELRCPCCERMVRVYRRKLHSEMARFLLQLVSLYRKYPRYYSMREIMPRDNKASSDGTYLVHWGLIEKADGTNTAMAPAGTYRPTELGLRFAHEVEAVPSHVHLLNNKPIGWSDKQITIRKALGSKFNYDELMK